ncbi:hypothetical protein [Caulobacter sp. NIBR1757]|uniref:hypothetical protein n=1 Tax=Caulobacter sp. NIBR1757 TaxID=3016000 RepID=UPI0022F09334|nr:hypothetical protein [Caulobacter sp. NIBR1757]WGM39243.1 hypothetical protein AMEJIAPC_02160 [Caulobacter sp. NIBR1757]
MRHRIVSWAFKGLAAAGLAASLSACNMVVTSEPTFLAEDQGMPTLREGLWVNKEKGCKFDIKAPATKWPECAHWIVVKGSAMTGVSDKGEAFNLPFILAAGDPRVLQIQLEDEKKGEDGKAATLYLYMGLKALKTDKEGRITAYSGWMVQCGPPPPKDAKKPDGNPRYGTLEPSPGMIMDDELSGCAPESKVALIKAAGLSEDFEDGGTGGEDSRWVRDGDQ